MRATRTNDNALIVAARAGDRRAVDELVTAYLPLVYTLVRRALGARPDVDDVVQEILLRAVRELRVLRDPDSFQPWLAAIAVRHISTFLRRERATAARTAALDDLADLPDTDADVEGVTLLRLELSTQRRQVVRARQWMDPDDRALLSLWWLEVAGQLTRSDLAAALGVSMAHAGVRVQRMRHQLDQSRSIVAAMQARPMCPQLSAAVAEWDGRPSPLWRKRIARHTRSCPACARAGEGIVAAERLLVGTTLVPVPVALIAAVVGQGASSAGAVGAASAAAWSSATAAGTPAGAGVKVGLLSQLIQAAGTHPVAATVAIGALVVGTIITTASRPPSPPPAPPAIAAPTVVTPTAPGTSAPAVQQPVTVPAAPPAAGPSVAASGSPAVGPVSLESVNAPGTFVTTAADLGVLAAVAANDVPAAVRATFEVVAGLADPNCFSFRAPDGRYLRHASWRLRLNPDEGTELYRGDATFCVRPGTVDGSVSFESSNYPGWFLRHRGDQLWVDHSDGTEAFRADGSFFVRSPLTG